MPESLLLWRNTLVLHVPLNVFGHLIRVELSFSSVICGLAYKHMHKRNCAPVKYLINNSWGFAMVCFFINYDLSTRDPHYLALAHPLSCTGFSPNLHINDVVVINFSAIYSNCIYIAFNDGCESAYV